MAKMSEAVGRMGNERHLGDEILEVSVVSKLAGHRRFTVRSYPIVRAREMAGLSQAQFAALLGVSVRTLQIGSRTSRAQRGGKDRSRSLS